MATYQRQLELTALLRRRYKCCNVVTNHVTSSRISKVPIYFYFWVVFALGTGLKAVAQMIH